MCSWYQRYHLGGSRPTPSYTVTYTTASALITKSYSRFKIKTTKGGKSMSTYIESLPTDANEPVIAYEIMDELTRINSTVSVKIQDMARRPSSRRRRDGFRPQMPTTRSAREKIHVVQEKSGASKMSRRDEYHQMI